MSETISDPFSLEGRTILVTGASSGIGQCVAVRASRRGARLVLLARDEGRLNETRNMLEGKGHSLISLDLQVTEEIEARFGEALKETGPLHGFVHSAGLASTTLLRDETPEHMEEIMRVNWLAFMVLSKAVCRRGRYAPGMSVVGIASLAAVNTPTGLSAYVGSKGALVAAARSLASEYAPRGIRFNCVSPAYVSTPILCTSRERLGEDWYQKEILDKAKLGTLAPEDVADPVLFLLSDASRRVTGVNLIIDGGSFLT